MVADAEDKGNIAVLKRFYLLLNKVIPCPGLIVGKVPHIQSAARIQFAGIVLVHLIDGAKISQVPVEGWMELLGVACDGGHDQIAAVAGVA